MDMIEDIDPRDNIGKPYKRGMLPYGGATGRGGRISFVVTKEEYLEKMERLKNLL